MVSCEIMRLNPPGRFEFCNSSAPTVKQTMDTARYTAIIAHCPVPRLKYRLGPFPALGIATDRRAML